MESKNIHLHYRYNLFYVTTFLLVSIILLLTVQLGNVPDVVSYISFGLTLTSLFLSLIAIIYSIVSNFSFTSNISSLRNASDTVTNSASKLTDITDELKRNLECIPGMISDVRDSVVNSHNEVMTAISESNAGVDESSRVSSSASITDGFIELASASGAMILYSCHLSYVKDKPFSLPDLCEATHFFDQDYFYGFVVACSSMGLISYVRTKDIISVKKFNSNIEDIKTVCETRVKKLAKDNPELFDDENELFKNSIGAIDEFFA